MYIEMIKRLYLLFSILIVISSNFVVKSEIDYSDEELELFEENNNITILRMDSGNLWT